jgi:CRISPR/Cas system-associated endonuclease Cas1
MRSNALLYLNGHGTSLNVKARSLVIQSMGVSTAYQPGAHELQSIILDGRGVMVTGAALAWAANEQVELLIRGAPDSLSHFAPSAKLNRAALNLRSNQFRCAINPAKSLKVAKELLRRKVKSEHGGRAQSEFGAAIRAAKTAADLRHIEAKSSYLWWAQWKGFELRLPATMPDKWRFFTIRYIRRPQGILGELPPQFTPRRAVLPAQSIHNYGIDVLATRMSRVLLAHGYDIGFGFLHDGFKPGRASLVWCPIEEHRATLARRLFDYMGGKTFKAADFSMRDSGEVRIGRIVSVEVAHEAIKAVPISKLVATANWLGKVLKETAGC